MNFISAKFCGKTIQINLDQVRMVSEHCGGTNLFFSNGEMLWLEHEPYPKFEVKLIEMQVLL